MRLVTQIYIFYLLFTGNTFAGFAVTDCDITFKSCGSSLTDNDQQTVKKILAKIDRGYNRYLLFAPQFNSLCNSLMNKMEIGSNKLRDMENSGRNTGLAKTEYSEVVKAYFDLVKKIQENRSVKINPKCEEELKQNRTCLNIESQNISVNQPNGFCCDRGMNNLDPMWKTLPNGCEQRLEWTKEGLRVKGSPVRLGTSSAPCQ